MGDSRVKNEEINKYRICLIGIYIGELPDMITMWLMSCRYNPTIDFLVITDRKVKYQLPENVKNLVLSFEEIKQRIQKNFDFDIVLTRPYKLCDYRVCYGEVFHEYLKGYDFWGYCDFDVVWGDIRKFITNDILEKNIRIMPHGHFTLIKNNDSCNALYRTLKREDVWSYQQVFSVEETRAFDEWGGDDNLGTTWLFTKNGISVFVQNNYSDISYVKYRLASAENKNNIILFDKGKLKVLSMENGELQTRELLYAHLPKRNFKKCYYDSFVVLPHHRLKKCEADSVRNNHLKYFRLD